jgi:hypothetical protein
MELTFHEDRRILDPFLYFNTTRLPTLTDVIFRNDSQLLVAHRSAGKYYLFEMNIQKGLASILDTIEVQQPPDLITICNDTIYSVNFTNILTKITLEGNRFGAVEYIPIHESNIYHGITAYNKKLYCTQTKEQYVNTFQRYGITIIDTESMNVSHRFPEHSRDRIKQVAFMEDTYILMLISKNYWKYANSTMEHPILLTNSALLLLDIETWNTLDSVPIPYSHSDSIVSQNNEFFLTYHSGFEGGHILRGKVENGKFCSIQNTKTKDFPHGISIRNDLLLYTSYDTSSLYIHTINELVWNSYRDGKWKLPHYKEPVQKDMVVLLPFFNPTQSTRLLQNLLTVRNTLERANIPFYIGELAFGNEPFSLPTDTHVLQFRSNTLGFYKEWIANRLIEKVKEHKVVLMDSDILFEQMDWYTTLSNLLESHEVIQPFDTVKYLGFDMKPKSELPSITSSSESHSASGHVWAFRTSWWKANGGLYEYSVIGGGDLYLCKQLGIGTTVLVNYMTGTIYHLPHGSSDNRQYISRNQKVQDFLDKHNTSIEDCFYTENNRIECRESIRSEWNTILQSYFEERQDDGL